MAEFAMLLATTVIAGTIYVVLLWALGWLPALALKPMLEWGVATALTLAALLVNAVVQQSTAASLAFVLGLAAVPFSFMFWSVLHWGASVTMWRVIRTSDTDLTLEEWSQRVAGGAPMTAMVDNRLDLLRRLRLIHPVPQSGVNEVTIIGLLLVRITSPLRTRQQGQS
jgi:hypothetical protein